MSPSSRSQKVCWSFAKYGECPKGNKCNLTHETPGNIPIPRKKSKFIVKCNGNVVVTSYGFTTPIKISSPPVSPRTQNTLPPLIYTSSISDAIPSPKITSEDNLTSWRMFTPQNNLERLKSRESQLVIEKKYISEDVSLLEKSLEDKKKQYEELKQELERLKELSLANQEISIASTSIPSPIIIQPIVYDEPEFLPPKKSIVWNFNSCTGGCTLGMCVPQAFDSKTSELIETSYKNKTPSFRIKTSQFEYMIDFTTMTQTNISTGTIRGIDREIKVISEKNPVFRDTTVSIGFQTHSFNDQYGDDVSFDELSEHDDEFKVIEDHFLDPDMRRIGATITEITRISNPQSAKLYELRKEHLNDKTEAMVFYGCGTSGTKNLSDITQEGLDIRLCRGKFGRGLHGSRSSYHVHKSFTNPPANKTTRCMVYAKFLVGNSKHIEYEDCSLVRPPPDHDSVKAIVDTDGNPTTVHVVYDNTQSYISYVIKYSLSGKTRPEHKLTSSQTKFSILRGE